MLVELDVFSGRPNPRWELDERSAGTLMGLVRRLSATRQAPPEPPALGYRGFRFGDRWLAYDGHVSSPGAVLADPSRTVERFLFDHLPPELAPLRRRLASELGLPE